MTRRAPFWILLSLAASPFVLGAGQQAPAQAGPNSEQVYKNIQSFKGVPASDLIPAMEFMCASLKFECDDCHKPNDFAAETEGKSTARRMIAMQRDINAKYFNGRLEVTCNSCHRGAEHPSGTPIPESVTMRHQRLENAPKPEDLFAKHVAAMGSVPTLLLREGSLVAPNDETHKMETTPLKFWQGSDGQFRSESGARLVGSDGKQVFYGGYPMDGEGAAIFNRVGRAWRGANSFAGLERLSVTGQEKIGKLTTTVVRGTRPASTSTEELYFDNKSGLLVRLVNIKRSSLGTVITSFDYMNYKKVGGTQAPMKVVATFVSDVKWTMEFKSAKTMDAIDSKLFQFGGQ